jgi:hypothetical protein
MPAMVTDSIVTEGRVTRLAPADRQPGKRGVRGTVAAALPLLSLVALSTNWWHGHGGGSGGNYQFTDDGWRGWAAPLFLGVAGALALAGAVLWKTRTRRGVAAGIVIAATALVVGAWAADIGQSFAAVSAESYGAAALGTPRTVLEQRLGAAFTTDASETLRSGATIGCDLYRAQASTGQGGYFFCFRSGVLVSKFTWPGPL